MATLIEAGERPDELDQTIDRAPWWRRLAATIFLR
jgi:hypothetical protein